MATLCIDLLRHGVCDDGAIYRGRTDSELSDKGWLQLQQAIDQLQQPGWQQLYCSPLQRCRSAAERFADQLALPLVIDERLREYDFGDWDGRSTEQVWREQPDEVLAFWQDPVCFAPPGAEPYPDLEQRLKSIIRHWLKQLLDSGEAQQQLLCLTHAGVIRTLLCLLLGLPINAGQSLSIDYGSLTRLELYPELETGPEGQVRYHSQLIFSNRLPSL